MSKFHEAIEEVLEDDTTASFCTDHVINEEDLTELTRRVQIHPTLWEISIRVRFSPRLVKDVLVKNEHNTFSGSRVRIIGTLVCKWRGIPFELIRVLSFFL